MARGYCGGHYCQLRDGRPLATLQVQRRYKRPEDNACDFDGCIRKVKAFGLCEAHNAQMKRTGRTWRHRSDDTLADRLLKYRKIDEVTGCWLWVGGTSNGYGMVTVNGTGNLVHRLAYTFWVGSIPPKETVHHRCANRPCFNPEHLELATHRANLGEMFARNAYKARIRELEAQVAELQAQIQAI